MHASHPHVAIMDSGVGGLSVVRALRQVLPRAHLTYVADAAACPYGERGADEVVDRVLTLGRLIELGRQPDVLVVACNTASTVVLPTLRQHLKTPVVGVVPAIKTAATLTQNRRIGLLATPATVNRPYVAALHQQFASKCELVRVGSSELVGLAENWLWHQAWPPVERLKKIVQPLVDAEVDTVVLGCTHFPLLRPMLQSVLGPEVRLVDASEAVARRVVTVLNEHGRISGLAPDAASEAWITQSLAAPLSDTVRQAFQREGLSVVRALLWPSDTQTAHEGVGREPQDNGVQASDQAGQLEHGQELDKRNGLAVSTISGLHIAPET